MQPFVKLTSRVIPLPYENIDTDQIIPAKYLKVTKKTGLGEGLFSSWRYLQNGETNPEFPLNLPEYQNAKILLAGDNFGCGSSREHAPWAIVDWGIRAIISTSFADIFRANAIKNSLLPVVITQEEHQQLLDLIAIDPICEIQINLADQFVQLPDGRSFDFYIDPFNRNCLLNGIDQLGYLQSHKPEIIAYEIAHE
jgi:3-isopropylmalate/(R)-2-methylmalate dehydratase small subunit